MWPGAGVRRRGWVLGAGCWDDAAGFPPQVPVIVISGSGGDGRGDIPQGQGMTTVAPPHPLGGEQPRGGAGRTSSPHRARTRDARAGGVPCSAEGFGHGERSRHRESSGRGSRFDRGEQSDRGERSGHRELPGDGEGSGADRRSRGSWRSRALGHVLVVLVVALGSVLGAGGVEAAPPAPRWSWPVDPPYRVVRPFEAPAHAYGPGHRGVDLAGGGTRVLAVEGGVVRFAGPVAGRGVVSVLHADGLISTYEPVTATVTAGDVVSTGTVLGELVGAGSHCAEAACLHLGARRGDDYLDPMLLLGMRGPSVLLPLGGAGAGAAGAGGGGGGPSAGVGAEAGREGEGPVSVATEGDARGHAEAVAAVAEMLRAVEGVERGG